MRRLVTIRLTMTSAAVLLSLTLLAACGNGEGGEQTATAGAVPAADDGCDEALVREAIDNSGAAAAFEYDITYLECAEGFGWAILDPTLENFDTGTALLRVSGTEVELLDLGTSLCTADYGIPPEVAAQIAPPGTNPAGDCPGPAPVQAEPDFTG